MLRERRWVPFWVACGTLSLFWFCRSAVYEGDGDQIARFIEAGYWFVRTEILSQAVFQLVYHVSSLWGWDGFLVMNLVSCLAGAILVYYLLRIGGDLGELPFTALFVLLSGFIVLAAGHTEYYTQLLAAVAAWNWSCIRFLRGKGSLLAASLFFSLCVWVHQEALFALPAHVLLPFLRKGRDQWVPWTIGLVPLGFLFLVRFVPQVSSLLLTGMGHGWNTVPLWTTEGTEKLYTMFEWAHWRDVLYALGRRSILAWPVIVVGAVFLRGKIFELNLRRITYFLWVHCVCFWVLCILWHPNLGIEVDWDLFVVEAVPSTILALVFLPSVLARRFLYLAVICGMCFSGLTTWESIFERAHFGRRGRGAIEIRAEASEDLAIKLDGHQKGRVITSVLEGRHELRLIHRKERWAARYLVVVSPGQTTRVVVNRALDVHPKPLSNRLP